MFSILMTWLPDKSLILQWEVWLPSLFGLKGLIAGNRPQWHLNWNKILILLLQSYPNYEDTWYIAKLHVNYVEVCVPSHVWDVQKEAVWRQVYNQPKTNGQHHHYHYCYWMNGSYDLDSYEIAVAYCDQLLTNEHICTAVPGNLMLCFLSTVCHAKDSVTEHVSQLLSDLGVPWLEVKRKAWGLTVPRGLQSVRAI